MGKQSSGWKKSPMNNTGPNDQSPDIEPKRSFGQKLIAQFREVFGMFLYLWALFALFTYHKAIVLAQQAHQRAQVIADVVAVGGEKRHEPPLHTGLWASRGERWPLV